MDYIFLSAIVIIASGHPWIALGLLVITKEKK
jgi:hypothetical protein